MVKNFIRAAGLATAVAFAAPAFAGGVTVSDTDNGKLKLGGKTFINATNKTVKNPAAGGNTKTTGVNVDRFYIEAKYYINDMWMARFTSDVNTENTLSKRKNVFLKYAYIEGKFSDELQLRLGLSHTPWIDYEQGLWKHRYVAKVVSDDYGYDTSADYGVGLKGKLADGMVKYWLTATNGNGYGNPTVSNGIDFNSRVSVEPIKGLDVSLQYFTGYKGTKTFVNGVGAPGTKTTMTQVMASYGNKQYRAGANYMTRKVANGGADDKLMTVWGWAKFADQFGAFARYASNKNIASQKDNRTVVGAEYFAAHGLTYSLAWTGTDNKATNVKSDTIGIYSQFAW